MFRFFRDIRRTLISDNTRKYLLYAFGEIILVVIGILLALQINTWNQERQNRQREQVILSDLHEEFLNNSSQLEHVITGHSRSYQSTKWLLYHFDMLMEEPKDSVTYHLKMMMSAYTFNPSQSGVQALINTSSFELIRNHELRQRLLQWTDQYKDYAEEEESAKDAFENYLVEYIQKEGDLRIFSPLVEPMENPDFTPYTTLEFRNLLHGRQIVLFFILESYDNELSLIQDNMNAIIELTSPD